MLCTATELMKYHVQATDGDAGRIEDVLFDDERWGVRYLVVDTGDWLMSRRVLLSPASVARGGEATDPLRVNLTRKRIESSPDADTSKPVSRRYEAAHAMHYGYPHYWNGPYLWGAGIYPGVIPLGTGAEQGTAASDTEDAARREEEKATESHLRSASEVVGYGVEASDGAAGTVDDFVVDVDTWGIVRLVVDARKWWPGGRVLIAPDKVSGIDWDQRSVRLICSRQEVAESPTP